MTIVIPRSVWQPRHGNGCAIIGTQEWENAGRELWLHHSITNPPGPGATLEQDCAHMRDFEAIGESRFGCGISYTWVVMPSGRVFQGHDVDRQGTHTYGRNDRSRAICLAGNYDVNDLPQRMRNAVAQLLRELGATLDGGHRDVYATKCPGDYAYAKIGAMNSLATSGVPIGDGGPGGGSGNEGINDNMPNLIKGDQSDAVWLVTVHESGAAWKVHVPDPTVLAVFQSLLGHTTRIVPQGHIDYIGEYEAPPLADVDEEALAEALEARGIDGANPAEVKAALTDVLARTGLHVSPAPTGV